MLLLSYLLFSRSAVKDIHLFDEKCIEFLQKSKIRINFHKL